MKDSKYFLRVVGAGIGIIGPPISLYLIYIINYSGLEFKEFINRLLYTSLFAPMLSLAVLINLLMFFGFIWLNKDEGARGVLMSTLLYAFVVFGLKLFA